MAGCLTCARTVAPPALAILYNGVKALTRAETCADCYSTPGIDFAK